MLEKRFHKLLLGIDFRKERVMSWSKIKAIYALVTGGVAGFLKFELDVFNNKVLAKITSKEAGLKYMHDVQAVYVLIRTILTNHADDISEKAKAAGDAILATLEELTKALEDYRISEDELDAIIDKVKAAIDVWKKAWK